MKKEKKVSHVQVCSILLDIFIPHFGVLQMSDVLRARSKRSLFMLSMFPSHGKIWITILNRPKMLFISESVRIQRHIICERKPNFIAQNKTSLVSFLSSVLECFLIKNGFSLPKGLASGSSSPSPRTRKRKRLGRYQFDDSGYAEPASTLEEDQHLHMSVPDSSTTFYTTPVSSHIPSWPIYVVLTI